MKNRAILIASLILSPLTSYSALLVTELDFSSNTIEITNTGSTSFAGSTLEWCVPFAYGTLESSSFTYISGEVRTYNVSSLTNVGGDDLWIYLNRSGGFSDMSAVITGAVWGSDQSGQGRVDAAVSGSSAWGSNTDFISTSGLGAGQTLQLDPANPVSGSSANWSIGTANLGTFAIPEPSSLLLTSLGGLLLLARKRH